VEAGGVRETVPEKAEARVTVSPPSRLTSDERQALRREVDRRRRAKLAGADREEAERLLALFADERPLA
jgi:hypothetical protein